MLGTLSEIHSVPLKKENYLKGKGGNKIYTHVSNRDIGKIKSPLDRLFEKENGGGAKG